MLRYFIVASFLIELSEQILYSTDACPLVYLHFGVKTVRKGSLCCKEIPKNSTICQEGGELFWSETELPLSNLSNFDPKSSSESNSTPKTQKETVSDKTSGKFAHLYPISDWKKSGWLDDDYEKIINTYWLDFPPPPHSAHYAFALIYSILTVVSLIGNSLVLALIVCVKHLRTPSNILVGNLAIADFFMMARGPIFIFNCIHFGPVTGYLGCQIYGVIGGLTGISAIMTLAAIARDRCSAIIHPFDPAYKLSTTKALLFVAFIWMYAAIFSTIPLTCRRLGVKPYLPEGAWFIPFIIITSSYYKICRHVLNSSVTRIGQERQQRKQELRLAGVVILVIGIWFLSWTPYATVALIGVSGHRHLLTPFITMVPAVFCKTAASIDPFLYALNHPRFKRELFKLWCPKTFEDRRADEVMNNHVAIWRSNNSIRLNVIKPPAALMAEPVANNCLGSPQHDN